jgi:uncharacterized protein (TIGR02145 family)
MTDAQAVAADKDALAIMYTAGDSAASVTGNIGLPVSGANGTSIGWATDDSGRIGIDGKVNRPACNSGDTVVTLIATISKGTAGDVKVFTLTVRAADHPETVTDIDGNSYTIVTIGDQVWTVENLRTTKLNDGTSIPKVADSVAWSACAAPAYCRYSNTANSDTINKLGVLYNWYAVATRKLAPVGWHVPDTAEWNTLVKYLIAHGYNWDGSTTGDKTAKSLAAGTDWASYTSTGAVGNDLTKNNRSGFSALPGGSRYFSGFFYDIGYFGLWWSASDYDSSHAWYRYLDYRHAFLHIYSDAKTCGLSVRLVRDAGPAAGTDVQAVAGDKNALAITYAAGDSAASVTGNVGLPAHGANGSGITWAAGDSSRIAIDGTVNRPAAGDGDAVVVLTATISKGTTGDVKTFSLTVRAAGYLGTVTDIDGNVYRTIKIGDQVWTAENMRTTKLNDGAAIPLAGDSAAWSTLAAPGYCRYGNTTNPDTINKAGMLYNWHAVHTQKLAPAGWHVPDTTEWNTLVKYLIANGYNWDGTTMEDKTAKSLAAKTDWAASASAGAIGDDLAKNNTSGFSAFPGGSRYSSGSFGDFGSIGSWWSATELDSSNACCRYLDCRHAFLHLYSDFKTRGMSVRLVRDTVKPGENGAVNLTKPDCGETFAVGGTIDITWTESGIINVEQFILSLSTDNAGTWTEIGRVNPGVLSFSHSPTSAQVGDLCRIRIASNDGSIVGQSDLAFSVVPANTTFLPSCGTSTTPITLLYPDSGDTFRIGDVVQFKFAISADFPYANVVAKVSGNGGKLPPVNINTNAAISLPARTFLWTVPEIITAGTMTFSLLGENYFRISDYESNQISSPVLVTIEGPAGMKRIAGGTFLMGSDSGTSAEKPVHGVTISPFWMDSTEVTQADYLTFMGLSPASFIGDPRLPVETVTWFDAVLYCNQRSKQNRRDTVYSYTSVIGTARDGHTGLGNLAINYAANGYRLPTEAEWEYACRAGSTTSYYWGSDTADKYAWYSTNSSGTTNPVATKQPNAWGLYDMSGNVWEMCNDWDSAYSSAAQTDPQGASSGSVRVTRGGGLDRSAQYLRSAARNAISPGGYLGNDVGFRVCLPAR